MRPDIKKILACIDFSKYSRRTFLYASYLADKTGCELIVLSCINQRDVDAATVYGRLIGATAISVDEFTARETKRREDRVVEGLKELGLENLERTTLIKVGDPTAEILKTISEHNIDLVIMGTRGLTEHDKYSVLTGSVAERVFKHSPVPVMSIRDE